MKDLREMGLFVYNTLSRIVPHVISPKSRKNILFNSQFREEPKHQEMYMLNTLRVIHCVSVTQPYLCTPAHDHLKVVNWLLQMLVPIRIQPKHNICCDLSNGPKGPTLSLTAPLQGDSALFQFATDTFD
jgi:hypothetical protein